MAILKDSLITGDLRVTGTIYGDANLSSLNASGTGLGTNGQILTSTGTGLAWSSSVAPSSHSHGNITNAGAIGTTANKGIYTGTNGVLTAGTIPVAAGGTGATSFTANSIIMSGSTTTAALTTRAVTNKTSNAAITNNNTNIPTMNTIYYGLVTVNNASQTRATGIYAPTSAGTKNQVLVSAGGTNAPTWATPEWTTVQIVRW